MLQTSDAISYKDAGVDIAQGDDAVERMKPAAKSTHTPGVLGGIGGFAALVSLKDAAPGIRDPVLVSGTDGVGTKLLVAIEADRHEDIGQDLVAMCVNDVLTVAAKPLFFLDYFASARIGESPLIRVVESIARACKSIGCALIGGETAEMPGLYAHRHYDLAGFCVGVVDRSRIIDGSRVRPGDAIIGLMSSGLHSNGFSLARKIIFDRMHRLVDDVFYEQCGTPVTVADALLTPTRLYVNSIIALLEENAPIHAMAHITGGGIAGNLTRAFPKGLSARINCKSWSEPPIFNILREQGPVLEDEMRQTFNLGIGYTLVVPANEAARVMSELESLGESAALIGEVIDSGSPVAFVD